MNAAIYARTSKEYKNQEKVSIPQQIEDGLSLAKNNGFKVDREHVFYDENYPSRIPPAQLADGAKKTRPALTRLFDAILAGKVQYVIARKRDRLARPYDLTRDIMRFFKEHNVGLMFTNEAGFPDDASGRFAANMLMLHADFELARMSENIRAAKRYQREHGLKMTHVRSIGFRDGEKGKVEIDTTVQPIVKQI